MSSRFDYRDPGADPEYCNGLSEEPIVFQCIFCGTHTDDETDWPYCSFRCVDAAREENTHD